MIKSLIVIEVEKNDRKYQLTFPPESTLGEIYDVIRQMGDEIIKQIENHQQSSKQKETAEDKNDE